MISGKKGIEMTFDNNQKLVSAAQRKGHENILIKDEAVLKNLSATTQDFKYLKDLCADPVRVAALEKAIREGKSLEIQDLKGVK